MKSSITRKYTRRLTVGHLLKAAKPATSAYISGVCFVAKFVATIFYQHTAGAELPSHGSRLKRFGHK